MAGLLTDQLQQVIQSSNAGLLSFGIIGSLWAASAGMKAMNRAYDVSESRPFLRMNLVAIGLTILFSAFAVVALALLVVGELLAQEVAALLGLPSLAVAIARWALALVFITLGVSLVYWRAPNMDLPFTWITPGSVLFTLGWDCGHRVLRLLRGQLRQLQRHLWRLGRVHRDVGLVLHVGLRPRPRCRVEYHHR